MDEAIKEYTPSGKIKRPSYSLVASWVKEAWDNIDPIMIRRSFKCCGISTEVDGSEDKYIFDFERVSGKKGAQVINIDEEEGENDESDEESGGESSEESGEESGKESGEKSGEESGEESENNSESGYYDNEEGNYVNIWD